MRIMYPLEKQSFGKLSQFDFHTGHNNASAIPPFLKYLFDNFTNERTSLRIFRYFSKAFDFVNNNILLKMIYMLDEQHIRLVQKLP